MSKCLLIEERFATLSLSLENEQRQLIEKIMVSKPDKQNSKRHRTVDIYCNTIGLWCAPSPEEMERQFQAHLAEKQKKTA